MVFHLHLPKPIHGWKMFFNEIAVISIGIGIALGGEQLLENWREGHMAEKSLVAIREELALNLGRMQARVATEDCLTARLNQIGEFIDPPKGTTPKRPTWVGRPQVWNMQTSAVQAARSYGSLTNLPPDEQMAISTTYASMASFEEIEREEQWAWAVLRSIADDRNLSDDDRSELRHALQRARYAAWHLRVSALQAVDDAEPLDVKPRPVANGSRSVCIPMDTPFAEAVKLSGTADIGEPR
ncbi:MAG: hypothetical protein ACREBK_00140 [Sphingomicrobium sp.]